MWFQAFIDQHQETIIQGWLEKIESEFPGLYNLIDLYPNGKKYFRLLVDKHIPLAQHPLFDTISIMCKYHAERGTPVEHILHSSHLWRAALLENIWSYVHINRMDQDLVWDVISILDARIDEVQRTICRLYWDYAQRIISQKQRKIEELHNDRLSLLGKMAASMAHEIKNPLFAIEGFLKLIRSELPCSSHAKINSYMDVVEKEFEGLYGQITSFLSFSKNSGTEESYMECSMSEIIDQVMRLIQPRTVNEKVVCVKKVEGDVNLIVQRVAIQQVLSNLINNSLDALKFVDDPKRITICSWEDLDHYYISVSDNGPGIPEELEGSIFEPFVTGKKHGTGLGLAICKQIMEKNEGNLSFSSRKGETVFTLTFVKNGRLGLLKRDIALSS
ncbi:sensor histidine kinase [Ammoniphilus sp. CFH 90114]|uniref:sensor histidine kinase n=1 Tax=Ammoniphilus sp. CFH 90114 TaxID=2493665 RepID=UPI00100FD8A8|nr:HAMP domain-containing sensor histidine kinase [Ammoniphilus sp. CFH 90114]RXT03733.1 HAMP domain-containing histidine kinase [Ammoniphilus sp. CFH 90114]